jgi:undecaprenyl diphosphate synthase
MKKLESDTKDFTEFTFNVALNYGGHAEIVKATKEIAQDVKDGKISIDDIDEKIFESHLYTHDQLPPDLIIRTSGEQRLSNFLMWESAYAELYFTPVYWPDFNEHDLDDAIEAFGRRDRRFGKIKI